MKTVESFILLVVFVVVVFAVSKQPLVTVYKKDTGKMIWKCCDEKTN